MEIKREQRIKANAENFLKGAPKGFLSTKQRKHKLSYYQIIADRRGGKLYRKQVNITGDWNLIWQLFEKRVQKVVIRRTSSNLMWLHKIQKELLPVNAEEIVKEQAESYGEAFYQNRENRLKHKIKTEYEKAPFDPERHTRVTDCGILVSSKSEQVLANTLYAYGIPFHYEERFHYKHGSIGKVYPDFTILLPDGTVIIWEHLGMLDKLQYCSRTVDKLNIYQLNGLVLNKNLIITMDDNKMNFGSDVINDVIQKFILPHFEGIDLKGLRS